MKFVKANLLSWKLFDLLEKVALDVVLSVIDNGTTMFALDTDGGRIMFVWNIFE